ncbi:Eco57I restriction-modification methylase domain-containing protein [Roseiflexus sp.]|uniref:Eco57I restriction-modification methylase domain-containing protein n=1 Tax=Roseiflexus sp. TaxID=2562120 RepID=UPI00398AF9FF
MTRIANHRQKSDIPAYLCAACDTLADGLGALPDDQRRSIAALTLARLMFLSFLREQSWLDARDFLHCLEQALCSGDALLAHLPASVVVCRHSIYPNAAALRQALILLRAASWSLDDNASDCLTPPMIGYVFERYVERKRGGIYYTGADVTSFIASCTIIPRLIDALSPDAIRLAADLIRRDPLRYIPAALRHGADRQLPDPIAAGVSDIAQRSGWDAVADVDYALSGETWRDVAVRRQHLEALLSTLRARPADLADLVTFNLDLVRLMRDLCAVWSPARLDELDAALARLTILDPTCGSGAFLCAAFDVLSDLAHIVAARGTSEQQDLLPLARRLHAIVEHNLYGVDVMPEAVEICRMRLWLRLAALVGNQDNLRNLRFNIHAGDALTGTVEPLDVATADDRSSQQMRLHWYETFPEVMAAGGFDVVIGNPPYVVRSGLKDDPALCSYQTASTGNLYALVIERALELLRQGGWLGMIVPIASIATTSMAPLQRLYAPLRQWHSHYAVRPGKLFPDVDMNLTITLVHNNPAAAERYTSGYRRFHACERMYLFDTLRYTRLPAMDGIDGLLPKLGSDLEVRLLQRMLSHGRRLRDYTAAKGRIVYYHSGGRYWRKALPEKLSSHYKPLPVVPEVAPIVLALLNSQVFYWYWIAFSNCMDVVTREVLEFPVFALEDADPTPFAGAVAQLLRCYREAATTRARRGRRIQTSETNIDAARAHVVISEIDRLLAQYYGFDDEELDFVLSYDLKYRLGSKRRLTSDHLPDDVIHHGYQQPVQRVAPPGASHTLSDQ